METLGLPRSYFYQRFLTAAYEVLSREAIQEDRRTEMVVKINLKEAVDRLKTCPVCHGELQSFPDYPLTRGCVDGCGEFTITNVYTDGDIDFTFNLVAEEKERDGDPVDPQGIGGGSLS